MGSGHGCRGAAPIEAPAWVISFIIVGPQERGTTPKAFESCITRELKDQYSAIGIILRAYLFTLTRINGRLSAERMDEVFLLSLA